MQCHQHAPGEQRPDRHGAVGSEAQVGAQQHEGRHEIDPEMDQEAAELSLARAGIGHGARAQSGMLSCFFHGFSRRFSRSMASARQRRRLVSWGVMTSSMKPREPATKGLANFCRYSSVRASNLAGAPASARKMISTPPFGPITAISAQGQA